MSNQLRTILAVILCAVAFLGEPAYQWIKNNVEVVNTPTVTIDEPSMEDKELVEDIVKINFSKEDADLVSCFFLELADVVGDD